MLHGEFWSLAVSMGMDEKARTSLCRSVITPVSLATISDNSVVL